MIITAICYWYFLLITVQKKLNFFVLPSVENTQIAMAKVKTKRERIKTHRNDFRRLVRILVRIRCRGIGEEFVRGSVGFRGRLEAAVMR